MKPNKGMEFIFRLGVAFSLWIILYALLIQNEVAYALLRDLPNKNAPQVVFMKIYVFFQMVGIGGSRGLALNLIWLGWGMGLWRLPNPAEHVYFWRLPNPAEHAYFWYSKKQIVCSPTRLYVKDPANPDKDIEYTEMREGINKPTGL